MSRCSLDSAMNYVYNGYDLSLGSLFRLLTHGLVGRHFHRRFFFMLLAWVG